MVSVTELLAEAGNLEKKLRQLDLDAKNGEQKKANLEKDITRLQGEANRLSEDLAGLSKTIKVHVDKAVAKEKFELAELQDSVNTTLNQLNEAKAETIKINDGLKTKVADNDRLRSNLKTAIEEAEVEKVEVNNLKQRLVSAAKLIKEALG